MFIRIGDVVSSEFGTGPVVAITHQWIVHLSKNGEEQAVQHDEIWIPAEFTPRVFSPLDKIEIMKKD